MAKKKSYQVKVTYTVCETFEVKAYNEEEAHEKAEEMSREKSLNDFIELECITECNGISVKH